MTTITNPNFPENLESAPAEDRRNVIDHYKSMSTDFIKADLNEKRLPFVCILENFAHDFNIATSIRNCNAFTAKEIHVVGRKRWDKRGAIGTYNYENIHYSEDLESVVEALRDEGYRIVAVDNIDGSHDVTDYEWQEKTAMIFGQEQIGISNTALELADDLVFIPMLGSTRSLNVGVASGIMMYDYVRKMV